MRNGFFLTMILGGAVLLAGGLPQAAAADSAPAHQSMKHASKNRLVVQVSDNDPKKWNLALNNIRNVQKALGKDNVEVELVAYGPGINMLKLDSVVANRIGDAVKGGVQVSACENTMRGHKLAKADMLSDIGYVPAGVLEIMKRQQEGWAYLRP